MRMLSSLFGHVVGLKNYLYDKNILPSFGAKAWVISIGNLTVGGTGKTPCTDFLISMLESKKHNLAVISRGYKSHKSGVNRVDSSQKHAGFLFGDEPTWLASRHPQTAVYISPDRVKGVALIEKEGSPEIIVADDAFQHRRLKRNRDIVVIDATERKENYALLPHGRGRESFDSLRRSHAVFVTKTNLVTPDVLKWIKGNVRFTKNIFFFEIKVEKIFKFGAPNELADFNGKTVGLVSGIGKPKNFENVLGNLTIGKHLQYKDHVHYDEGKVREILTLQEQIPVIITEKDYAKLRSYPILEGKNIWVCALRYELKSNLEELYECIRPKHS